MPRWVTDDQIFLYMETEKTKAMQMPSRRECTLIAQWFEY